MEPVAEHRAGDMSKSKVLRGIITEKLSTAAREILAAVERTVSGYEQEAAGFRLEVERQRRQLEALLQPRVKLEAVDDQQLFPISEPPLEEAPGSGEEQQHKYELSADADGGMSLTEEESPELASPTPTKGEEPITELELDTSSGLFPPSVQSDRPSSGRRRVSEAQNHVDLRIRILGDSRINILSSEVFQKYPLHQLQCPHGLQETDFLQLLRSTFPQLAADFDFFTTDRSRKLHPLKVRTLTPEEINRSIRSALYIRLKNQEELKVSDQEFHPSQREDAAADSPSCRSGVQSDSSMPQIKETCSHINLKLRILEDPETKMLSNEVFQKYPLHQLQCPHGLQETDFLQLLRSTFPQLAADFDFFTTDRSRKLHPLKLRTLTPEEINRSIRSNGQSALYIRLKHFDELQSREEQLQSTADQTNLNTSVQASRSKVGRPRCRDNRLYFKICILEDPRINRIFASRFETFQLQCPPGLREKEFLQLLRSTFPQLAADKPFDFLTSDRSNRLHRLRVKALTPEEVYRSIGSNGRSTLYIQLKAPEEAQSSKEMICLLQGGVDAADETRLREDTRSSSSTSQGQEDEDIKTNESDNEPLDLWSLLVSESEWEEDETTKKDSDWKPDRSEKSLRNKELQETQKRRAKRSHSKTKRSLASPPVSSPCTLTSDSKALPYCKVCGAVSRSVRFLIKHALSHVDDPAQLCGVCGESSESAEELRQHLQSHRNTHGCHICGKLFLSTTGLKGHIARHNGEKSYKCKICHKLFTKYCVLNAHMMTHGVKTSHACDVCQKSLSSETQLKLHHATHTDKKPFSCNVCAKSYRSVATLSQHTRAARRRERDHTSAKSAANSSTRPGSCRCT